MSSLVDRLWYGGGRPLRWLMPLSWLYQAVAEARRRKAWTERHQSLPVPVVVVGNITAGGTRKIPADRPAGGGHGGRGLATGDPEPGLSRQIPGIPVAGDR